MTRALVVIDVQESFRQLPTWHLNSNPAIVDQVNRLVVAARADRDLVLWVLHAAHGSATPFDPALGFVRLMDGLDPGPGEPLITKTSHNAFSTTNLAQLLTARGIRDLAICGIRTEQCCETTARVASDLGHRVTFVTDATATTPLAHRDAPPAQTPDELLADPRTMGVEDIVTRTEYVLAGRFARIRTIDEMAGSATAAALG